MKIWTEPRVTLVGKTRFTQPAHVPVNWGDVRDIQDPEHLIEFAGRVCYLSFHNPAGKTTEQYIDHIIEVSHESVLEHIYVSFYLEGISRTLSHEMVRHRHGNYSQLSQRFVEHIDVVMPPAILAFDESGTGAVAAAAWEVEVEEIVDAYKRTIGLLKKAGLSGKKLKEAARSVLPGCAETKMVMTANVRAWRLILKRRSAPDADAEIQRLAREILRQLKVLLPSCFKDIGNG